MSFTLRPDQARTIEEARKCVASGNNSVLIVGPTGFGKSVLAAEIARSHVAHGGKVLAVVHRVELVQQLAGKLRCLGLSVGEIHPGATPFPAPAQVASIQTLLARESLPPFTMMIWDEAHHILADTWNKLLPATELLIGLTATPILADGSGLGAAFTSMVVAASRKELRDSGVLVPCEVVAPDRPLGPRELAQDPIDAYFEHTPGEQAILFAPSVEVAIQTACRFRERDVPAVAVWGSMPAGHRIQAFEDFREGRARILANVAIATEGFDHPPTTVCILMRGVGHLGLYDQMVGRVLRSAPGKTRAVLIDLTGATHHCGPPDEERRYSLQGKGLRRAVDEPEVRFCPVCGSPSTTKECEQCGHAGEMRHRPPKVLGLPLQRFAAIRRDDELARAERLAKWLRLARAKGWKEGQALHRFKAAYGDWPSRQLVQKARTLG